MVRAVGRVQFSCGFGGVMDPTKSKWTMPNAKLVLGLSVLVGQCPLASFGRVHFLSGFGRVPKILGFGRVIYFYKRRKPAATE